MHNFAPLLCVKVRLAYDYDIPWFLIHPNRFKALKSIFIGNHRSAFKVTKIDFYFFDNLFYDLLLLILTQFLWFFFWNFFIFYEEKSIVIEIFEGKECWLTDKFKFRTCVRVWVIQFPPAEDFVVMLKESKQLSIITELGAARIVSSDMKRLQLSAFMIGQQWFLGIEF